MPKWAGQKEVGRLVSDVHQKYRERLANEELAEFSREPSAWRRHYQLIVGSSGDFHEHLDQMQVKGWSIEGELHTGQSQYGGVEYSIMMSKSKSPQWWKEFTINTISAKYNVTVDSEKLVVIPPGDSTESSAPAAPPASNPTEQTFEELYGRNT